MKTKPCHLFFLLASLAMLAPTARAVVGFTVTPATVSNTYNGIITLQITGLSTGETVVVQKFLDANANGVIDGADSLWQQFNLTDGQAGLVIAGVTNFNVPGDTDTTPGRITARLNFQNDFSQFVIGKYAYKLSSPAGLFTPITNSFTVTNAAYAQGLTGHVLNNGTNVPGAVVFVLHPPRPGHGTGAPLAGTVADSSGRYTIKLPPGTYVPAAVKSNFLGNLSALPVTVGSGTTVTADITLINATQTISGRLVDAANNSIGLPGLFVAATTAGLAGVGTSDANGNFALRVVPEHWRLGANGMEALGYLGVDSENVLIDTTTGSVSGLVLSYPKATALVYGSVTNDQNQPLAGVNVDSENSHYFYFQNAFTDINGNYVAGALGGELWHVQVDSDQPTVTNYIFSSGLYTNLSVGQTALHNFTAILATNHITGLLRDDGGIAISNVQIYAYANIGGNDYYIETDTDASGRYALNVANGNWTVGVCFECNDGSLGYCRPNDQNVTISNANGVVNFTAPGKIVITTPTRLPDGYVDDYYSTNFDAVTCVPGANWSASNLPSGLELSPGGELSGYPDTCGSNYFVVRVDDGSGSSATKAFSLVIHPPTTGSVSDVFVHKLRSYRQTSAVSVVLDASQGPYNAYLGIDQDTPCLVSNATCTLPTGVVKVFPLDSNALELLVHESFASEPAFAAAYPAGNYSFRIHTTSGEDLFPVLNLPAPIYPNAPHISNYTAAQAVDPDGDFLLQWDAFSGGTAADYIELVIIDTNTVPVISLMNPGAVFDYSLDSGATSVTIPAGTLQAGGNYLGLLRFIRPADVSDVNYPNLSGQAAVAAQTVFRLATVSPAPILTEPVKPSATQFRFLLTGIAMQNYTIQKSTNLSPGSWSFLFVTNSPVSSFMVIDPTATNRRAFYRALVGP